MSALNLKVLADTGIIKHSASLIFYFGDHIYYYSTVLSVYRDTGFNKKILASQDNGVDAVAIFCD